MTYALHLHESTFRAAPRYPSTRTRHTLARWISVLGLGGMLSTAAVAGTPAASANPHPTIRAMSGATPIDHLDPATTALLVIDFQSEYFTGRMPIPDGKAAMAHAHKLIAFADQHKIPVFQIQHIAAAGSAVFAIDGETVKFHPDSQPRPGDIVVQKKNVSVFAGTDIDAQLKARHIKTLVISGLMTHACVAGAARDAAPAGYQVIVASDATATRALQRADGSPVDAADLHQSALAEIEDTFGDVMTTAQITALPVR